MELPTPLIGNKAHQPRKFQFPQCQFGKTSIVKRSFQQPSEDQDLAFCFSCIVAYQNNQLQSAHCLEKTFISTGFSNWKDAIAKFTKHEGSRCHKDAVLNTITLPATTSDILAKERLERRKCFYQMFVSFLDKALHFVAMEISPIPILCS